MNKESNESYKRIIDYIKNHPQVDNTRKRELLQYASKLIISNIENVKNVNVEDIQNDLSLYRYYVENCDDTILTRKRIDKAYEILELYHSYCANGEDVLDLISEKLDMLFLESDLGIRKGSNLSYSLTKELSKESKKHNFAKEINNDR